MMNGGICPLVALEKERQQAIPCALNTTHHAGVGVVGSTQQILNVTPTQGRVPSDEGTKAPNRYDSVFPMSPRIVSYS